MSRRAPNVRLLIAIGAGLTFAVAAATTAFPQMTARVIDTYVVPRFERLERASETLSSDLDAACGGASQRMDAVREDFKRLALAWAGVEFLRFGPMLVTGRPERFAFWPDPRRVMERQLRGLVARREASALDPELLAKKSAAIQGLPALEALLWDTKHPLGAAGEEARYRCRLAVAISRNLNGMVREMLSDWRGKEGWRQLMLQPGPHNASYRIPTEPPAEFARALITGLQMIQDRQVVPLMEAEEKPGKRPRLPFALSGLSADYLGASIASTKALYEAMDLAHEIPRDKLWMPRWIEMAFKRLAHDAPAAVRLEPSKEKDPERERTLRFLRFNVEGIRKLVGREIAPLAGLTIGFNELDGD